MNNKKSTKRTLLTSVLSLILCMSMLIGTTFAWFTDSVTSGKNRIQAGNLDVEMSYKNTSMTEWEDVEVPTSPDFFKDINGDQILWEPGAVAYANFKVENKGSLALKYSLETIVAGCNYTPAGKSLADVLTVKVIKDEVTYETREDAVTAAQGSTDTLESFAHVNTNMEKDTTDYFTVVLYWEPSSNDNDFNVDPALWIDIELSLVATQAVNEEDSFDNTYDADALVCDVLATPETINDILATVGEGTVIGLSAGTYGNITITKDNLTLISNSAIVDFVNLNAKDGITLDGITFDTANAQQTYTTGTGGKTTATKYVANITGDTDKVTGADNVVIKNCTFTNTSGVATASATEYAPIYFNEVSAPTAKATNITVSNCVFACNATNYIAMNYVQGDVVIKNNTFGGGVYGTSHHNINATSNSANWIISSNSFNNWADEEYAFGSSRSTATGIITLTITDNSFVKAISADESIPVLSFKSSYTAANSAVTVEDNTFNYGTADISWNADECKYYMTAETSLTVASNGAELAQAVKAGGYVALTDDATATSTKGGYNQAGLAPKAGSVLDGNGNELNVTGANGTWDCAIYTTGGTIKNLTIGGAFRGIFTAGCSADIIIDNCVIDDVCYTFNSDGANANYSVIVTNSTLNGWTSYSGSYKSVSFTDCNFGQGTGGYKYAFCRPYSETTFTNCVFEEGFEFDASRTTNTFVNCYVGETLITADNITTLLGEGAANAVVK